MGLLAPTLELNQSLKEIRLCLRRGRRGRRAQRLTIQVLDLDRLGSHLFSTLVSYMTSHKLLNPPQALLPQL